MRQPRSGSTEREHLMKTALALFANNEIHSTGNDTIAEQSCVTKNTLHAYFCSEEELGLAVLGQYDGLVRIEFMRKVECGRESVVRFCNS